MVDKSQLRNEGRVCSICGRSIWFDENCRHLPGVAYKVGPDRGNQTLCTVISGRRREKQCKTLY